MAAITTRQPDIAITYLSRGKRAHKEFTGEQIAEARRFYEKKLKEEKAPAVEGEQAAAVTEPVDEETQELTDAVNAAIEANPAPATIKIPGVAATQKTRAYYAGVVIAAHGHAAGVTKEMVAELDAAYGKPNAVESEICLRNAWHCLRGAGVAATLAPSAADANA